MAMIDWALIVPLAMLLGRIAGAIADIHLPPREIGMWDLDLWLDLLLRGEPVIIMDLVLMLGVGLIYLLVFQITQGRTLGMRLLGARVIDVYGDPPSAARCLARTAAYVLSAGCGMLGFFWVAIDREKRGLHDILARTYVVRA